MSAVISPATTLQDFATFAELVGEYVDWCRARYSEDAWFVDQVFDRQSVDAELRDLPATYSLPAGRAFLAREGDAVVGCAAYRWRGSDVVEMKRLFVRHRGKGYGRQICRTLFAAAQADGARLMLLDTAHLLHEAIALYESMGFARRDPYNDYPPELMRYIIFMERPLPG
jgi:GNAT superfamily N-acetyltransferase